MILAPGAASFAIDACLSYPSETRQEWQSTIAQKGLCLTIGPGLLKSAANGVRSLISSDEDTSAPETRTACASFLAEADGLLEFSIYPASIEEFEQDILLRWDFNEKGLILTYHSAPQGFATMYREQVENNRAVSPETLEHASPTDLANAISWILASA
ncbi:MAG: hypothetical protein ABI693_31935 [Bryobacteraceae bacterium]